MKNSGGLECGVSNVVSTNPGLKYPSRAVLVRGDFRRPGTGYDTILDQATFSCLFIRRYQVDIDQALTMYIDRATKTKCSDFARGACVRIVRL